MATSNFVAVLSNHYSVFRHIRTGPSLFVLVASIFISRVPRRVTFFFTSESLVPYTITLLSSYLIFISFTSKLFASSFTAWLLIFQAFKRDLFSVLRVGHFDFLVLTSLLEPFILFADLVMFVCFFLKHTFISLAGFYSASLFFCHDSRILLPMAYGLRLLTLVPQSFGNFSKEFLPHG